jgi:hypothetical protein
MTDDGPFAPIPEWILYAEISALAVRVYGVLRRHADDRTRLAFPSRRTLADRVRASDVKTVDRPLIELAGIGAITVVPRIRDDGGRSSNGYLVHDTPVRSNGHPPIRSNGQGGRAKSAPDLTGQPDPLSATAEGGEGRRTDSPLSAVTEGGYPAERSAEREPTNENQQNETPPLPLGDLPPRHEEAQPRRRSPAEDFAEFWAAYPRKVGKGDAQRAWAKATKRTDPAKILDVIHRYPWRDDPQFIPYPATWLNRGCWEDDLVTVAATNGSRRGSGTRSSMADPLPPRDAYTYGDGNF